MLLSISKQGQVMLSILAMLKVLNDFIVPIIAQYSYYYFAFIAFGAVHKLRNEFFAAF